VPRTPRLWLPAVLVALSLTVAGCAGPRIRRAERVAARSTTSVAESTTTSTTTTTAPPATTTSAPPPTTANPRPCGPSGAPLTAGQRTVTSGGVSRDELVAIPDRFDPRTPTPVLLNFHGSGSDMGEQALYSRFPTLATARGYVVVSPNGTGEPRGFDFVGQSDVTFVSDLLADLGTAMCIDSHRIFTAGISNGSALSGKLLCQTPYRIAAAGMVSSPFPNTCPTDVVRPIIEFHGTDDPIVPYGGGPVHAAGFRGINSPGVLDTAAKWADHNGCTGATNLQIAPDVVRTGWTGCAPDGDIVLLTIQGGGHTWPGPIDVSKLGIEDLGATTSSIDATQLILDFFDTHPLP
jgi:polyhydroxybutyrate depolymerase